MWVRKLQGQGSFVSVVPAPRCSLPTSWALGAHTHSSDGETKEVSQVPRLVMVKTEISGNLVQSFRYQAYSVLWHGDTVDPQGLVTSDMSVVFLSPACVLRSVAWGLLLAPCVYLKCALWQLSLGTDRPMVWSLGTNDHETRWPVPPAPSQENELGCQTAPESV